MGDPYKGKLAGHVLIMGGRVPFQWPERKGGIGPARCTCGATSGDVGTIAQRQEWHRQHKANKIDSFVANGIDDRGREVHL